MSLGTGAFWRTPRPPGLERVGSGAVELEGRDRLPPTGSHPRAPPLAPSAWGSHLVTCPCASDNDLTTLVGSCGGRGAGGVGGQGRSVRLPMGEGL